MKLVVDTNRIIAALLKESTSRKILLNTEIEFICPDHALSEIREHKEELTKKAGITGEEFETVISLLFERITIHPKQEYSNLITQAQELIKDKDDAPFLALCIASKPDGIWTDDKHFSEQNKIKVINTSELIELIR